VPPPRTPAHWRTGTVEPFRRASLACVPKAPPFLVARLAWARLTIGHAEFCLCLAPLRAPPQPGRPGSRRRRAPVRSQTRAAPHTHVRTRTCIRLRISSPSLGLPHPRCFAHARESSPAAPATPATPPVALPFAAAVPNPAKGRPFACLSVCFVNPSLALGQVVQHLLASPPARLSRDAAPFRPGVEHLVFRPKNLVGFFPSHAGPHAVEAAADPPRSGAPHRVTRRVSSNASCSWLKATALAATSTAGAL
jgi:hypothetical protein